ncbi:MULTISPECIES: phage antirepressor N-terminal domain-containing protein [unclassified Streptomyces]|uniref:phage antirepressor N-terminal domain-containing protein n=1 Tax=unclassified Streptomyces TaxID=2593676 RepID=UPI003702931B
MASIAPVSPAEVTLSVGSLLTVMHEEKPHVVLRPAVEALGLSYAAQYRKLKTRSWGCVAQKAMRLPGDPRTREVDVVPVRTLLMLLATVNENKVAPEVRPTLVAFQNETADAIESYWTKGQAVRPQAEVRQLAPARRLTPTTFRQIFFSDVPEKRFFDHLYRDYLIDQRNTRRDANGQYTKDGYRHGHPKAGKGDRFFQLPEDMWVDSKGRLRGRAVVRPDRVKELVEQLISEGLRHNPSVTRRPSRLALTSSEVIDGHVIEFRRGA